MMDRLRGQRGVAMITVLLVGAGLTAVSSVAAYSAINELRSANADARSSAALAYAEAGVDRFISHIRGGSYTFQEMNQAGCTVDGITYPPITVPTGLVGAEGAYAAELTVYHPGAVSPELRFPQDPSVAGDACTPFFGEPPPLGDSGGVRPRRIIDWPRVGSPPLPEAYFQITATGYVGSVEDFTARRVVRQIVKIQPKGLPIGVYGQRMDVGGAAQLVTISAFSETDVDGRNGVVFQGIDPYYTYGDIFPDNVDCPDLSVCGPNEHIPAAVHAAGSLIFTNNNFEFSSAAAGPGAPTNCSANTGNRQSLWDSDGSAFSGVLSVGCPGEVGRPINNRFTTGDLTRLVSKLTEDEYEALKATAKSSGIYCSFPGAGPGATGTDDCQVRGVSTGGNYQDGPETMEAAGVGRYVAYFEYRTGTPSANKVAWEDSVGPCPDESVTVIIRNGGISVNGNTVNNGAIIMDGDFDKANGGGFWNGPVIANGTVDARGTYDFHLDECWVDNMGGAFIKVTPTQWFEVDR